jgi:hypothetical protein
VLTGHLWPVGQALASMLLMFRVSNASKILGQFLSHKHLYLIHSSNVEYEKSAQTKSGHATIRETRIHSKFQCSTNRSFAIMITIITPESLVHSTQRN